MHILRLLAIGVIAFGISSRAAEDPDAVARPLLAQAIIAAPEAQPELIRQIGETGSPFARRVLTAWRQGEVFVHAFPDGTLVPWIWEGEIPTRIDNNEPLKDQTGAVVPIDRSTAKAVDTTSKLRKAIKGAVDFLTIADPDPQARRSAIAKLGFEQKPEFLPVLEARRAKESRKDVLRTIDESIALIQLRIADEAIQLSALKRLKELEAISTIDFVKRLAAEPGASVPVKAAAAQTLAAIQNHIWWVDFKGTLFRGLSSGSILLVVALGLAITFGLMGVINMAHGELIAVGAYTTYLVQNAFGTGLRLSPFSQVVQLPGLKLTGPAYDSYFLVSLPIAFCAAAGVGLLLERGVIRFLYRRPLESLLATWGVSLVLQQLFRLIFGSNNVQVSSPRWLSGNWTLDDVVLGWNRIFVIAFAALIVFATWLLLTKTPFGLRIRAVMQNRNMAACMGVHTERVNMMTFALGSGLAGLAGAFISQIGNVGPGLGQNYIVDCFMTVVVGGVGNLVGTIVSAMGIGVFDQVLQQLLLNPVLGKIIVLGAIILFLQWKPGGLFPTRSRALDS
jgi:urea transport system permease protein